MYRVEREVRQVKMRYKANERNLQGHAKVISDDISDDISDEMATGFSLPVRTVELIRYSNTTWCC